MSAPLYQAQAELYRTLGNPIRVHILELLQNDPRAVRELLAEVDVEPAHLSQQLAVLRRACLVKTYRDKGVVMYALATPAVEQILSLGRQALTGKAPLLAEFTTAGTGEG
ncbi:metalloregulator ArsR/SmtB family transcription factor [Actinoplanes sp. NPDC026670]|uniref:ArsR/SmtB family transcription factor n=1 Tax=Actinoplanes sp. NPDC026670 TaxID=3154700 RepID=UPI0033E5BF41